MMLHRLTIRRRLLVIFILIAFVGGAVQFLIAGPPTGSRYAGVSSAPPGNGCPAGFDHVL